MSERRKNRIDLIEEKLEKITRSKWAKGLRITSGVTWNLFLLFIIFGLTISVFAASVGAGYFASLVAKEPLRTKDEMRTTIFNYEETSEIYLADNVYLGKVSSDIERKETKLKDVSPYVIDAVFATEDEYFETHDGVVPKAIFRGLLQDVTNSDSQTGGSTLTQQLIKIRILTNEVSYERKAKEILLAMRLEKFMDKNEILEAYLNIIPYGRNSNGQNIAGVEAAAEGIFGLSAKELSLPQSAYIAGIPQAPFAYTPFYNRNRGLKEEKHLKPGIDRMKTVLFRMKETGYITKEQYDEAVVYDITKDFREQSTRSSEKYPYLTAEIQKHTIEILAKMIAEKDGIDVERLEKEPKLAEKYAILAQRSMRNDGFRIHATVDKALYDKMNDVAEAFELYGHTYTIEEKDPDTGETILKEDPVQVGGYMIENATGRTLAFVGGRDHSIEQFNHATQAFRQNGSSMKPLLVYAPAIEYGVIGAGSPVVDVKFEAPIPGQEPWSPSNYQAGQELGIIPARQALATSQNLATARLYKEIIDKRPADYLKKMGFSRLSPVDYTNLGASLGGIHNGVSVQENTNAYATFANGGKFIKSYIIEKIEDKNGNIIYQHEIEPVDVFSPETAYIMTDMLRDVPKIGTAKIMNGDLNFNIDIAAKTGTTQEYRDAWLVGYNPNISLGVWLGYKEPTRGLHQFKTKYVHPSTRVNKLFARFMNGANEVRPDIVGAASTFKQPDNVVSMDFCGISGLAPSPECTAAGLVRSDLFNQKVMMPVAPDDSIVSSSYVTVKGSNYLALPSTPMEFVSSGGTGVSQSFIERMLGPWKGDASKLFPSNSSLASQIVSGAIFEADDAPPAPVNVTLNGTTITWDASSSNDVIGYYVYENNDLVGTIHDGSPNTFHIGYGTYFVRAVDITGLLSGNSNAIHVEEEIQLPEPEIDIPEEAPDDNTNVPPTTPPDNGNGNGNHPPTDDDDEENNDN